MRLTLIILATLFSSICFSQQKPSDPKVDSLDLKVISMNEFINYINRINVVILKQFDLTERAKYELIEAQINAVINEINTKRRQKK